MNRWDTEKERESDSPEIDQFLADIVAVYVKHGLSLAHEDDHGAFEVETLSERNIDWLLDAHDSRARKL